MEKANGAYDPNATIAKGLQRENEYLRKCWEEAHNRHVRGLRTRTIQVAMAFFAGFLLSSICWMLIP